MRVFIILALGILPILSFCQEFGMPNNDPNYIATVVDLFDNYNSSFWQITTGGPPLPVTNPNEDPDPAIFTSRSTNVRWEQGSLKLTVQRENYLGYKFTAGQIRSNQAQNIGCYLEIRCLIAPNISGSAFWTWNGNGNCSSFNDYREIDILEYQPKFSSSTANFHYCIDGERKANVIHYPISKPYTWHNIACYWNSSGILHFLDHKPIPKTERKIYPSRMGESMYVVLTCGKQGWGVYPLPPSTFSVSIFRLWRLRPCDNTDINEILDFNNFSYTLKKSITLSNQTNIPTNKNISLRATDYIEFNDGFVLPNAQQDLVFNTNICE